jgi:hypothetical protein
MAIANHARSKSVGDLGVRVAEAIADLLAFGRRSTGSMRLARLVKTLPAINYSGSHPLGTRFEDGL